MLKVARPVEYMEAMGTYSLVLEALDNCKGARVVDVLHDEPVDCLEVVDIDPRRLDEFSLELGYRLGV